jgi:predicted pyridoxine 5'-phosphate oxidase superfamily flavin-nucleotide-binding protein
MSVPPAITREMLPAMQGVMPSAIATCGPDGTPNVTYISQLFYVDAQHVALSYQFMNKTWRNLQVNPVVYVVIQSPGTACMWKLGLRYLEQQTEGPVFDQMDMQLQAMTSMLPVKVDFKIKAAIICRVETVEQLYNGQNAS